MSIRLRITLLYSAILALTLAAFSVLLYVTVSQSTRGFVEDALIEETQRLIDAKEFRIDKIVLPASRFAGPETYVQTLTMNGDVTDRTANLGTVVLPLSSEGLQAVQGGQAWLETVKIENERLLIHSKPVESGGRLIGVVQVARSLAEQDRTLNTLRTILIIAGGAVLLAAFGGGWLLAGAALRPINRITQTAEAIGTDRDFDRRVTYSGPRDELGRLATTFNTMLSELQAAYRQVQQALQSQRRFVADASHELRTPLTTIRGNLALLEREPPISPEDRVAVLADIADECERLIRLVNDLLVLARADAGQSLHTEPVAIRPIVEEVCRQVSLLAPDRTIECHISDGAVANGNRDAIKQVLLILMDNALKYTPADGRISVETAVSNGRVSVSVSDTGPGIDPSVLPHIFERFYRGDYARSGTGTGLGLSIAKVLVEAQHGTLSAESRVAQGSRFTIELARASESAKTEDGNGAQPT